MSGFKARVWAALACGVFSLGAVGSDAATQIPASIKGTDLIGGKSVEVTLAGAPKPTVVVFLSMRCPCSRSHENELNALAERYKNFNFVAVHSNSDEPEAAAAAFFKGERLAFPVVQDERAEIANAFGALKTPHAYVVSADGKRLLYAGGVSDAHDFKAAHKFLLRAALENVAQGRDPDPSETRTLGCYIKR